MKNVLKVGVVTPTFKTEKTVLRMGADVKKACQLTGQKHEENN